MNVTRVATKLMILTLVALLLAACGPTPEPAVVEKVVTEVVKETVKETVVVEGTPQVVEKEVVVTATPEPGQEKLVIGIALEPTTLDPQSAPRTEDWWILDQVFDYLVAYDPKSKEIVPFLAESWEISADGLVYTFKLHEGVTFHDGTPFNAEAACANFTRIMDPATQSAWAKSYLGPYESCEVLSDYEIAVHFTTVHPDFLLGLTSVFMVSPTAAAEMGPRFMMKPVGSGPFMVEEWILNKHILLKRNPDYNWGPDFYTPGPARIEMLEFRAIPEDETRVVALKSGEVDMIAEVPNQHVASLREEGFTVSISEVGGTPRFLQVNMEKFPTDDLAVRKAIEYGLDRKAFADVLFQGVVTPAYAALSPADPSYDQSKSCEFYDYDPEKAMALLEEAGWKVGSDGIREKDGQRLQIYLPISETLDWTEPAELLQAQLREVGIDVTITEMARGAWYDEMNAGLHNIIPWRYTTMTTGIWQSHFHSSFIGKSSNYVRISDPEMDAWTEELLDAADPAEAQALRNQIACKAMDMALWVPIHNMVGTVAMKSNVKEDVFSYFGHPLLQSAYVE